MIHTVWIIQYIYLTIYSLCNDMKSAAWKKLGFTFRTDLTWFYNNYGGYPIIKQKLSERDLSRDSICMQTQLQNIRASWVFYNWICMHIESRDKSLSLLFYNWVPPVRSIECKISILESIRRSMELLSFILNIIVVKSSHIGSKSEP